MRKKSQTYVLFSKLGLEAIPLGLYLLFRLQFISLLRIFQLSHIVFHSYQSVQCVRACVCVSVGGGACVCVCGCVRVLTSLA